MKSIVQEASSITKAIERAWLSAGKPQEFSVKVFQEARKNFLGLTVENAKIALLFSAKPVVPVRARPAKPEPRAPQQQQREARKIREEEGVYWSDQMLAFVREWLEGVLKALEMKGISFSLEPKNYQLSVHFNKALITEGSRESQLFRTFSSILLQSLRNKFHRPMRGFQIIFTHK